jgi:O-antigen ligase
VMFVQLTMMFTCLAATFMTGSRAGVILSLLALVVAFNLYFRRRIAAGTGLLMIFFGSGLVALVLLQFMGEGIIERLDPRGAADEGRLETYRAILRMIADHPWLGTGQGTFAAAYPAYRSSEVSMWGVWDIAHNTLLEIAADMGIPIAVLVVLAWVAIFVTLIYGVRHRNRDLVVPISALAVAMLAILHSLVDFSLQIPGYGIVALALIGSGLAQSFSTRSHLKAGGSIKGRRVAATPEVVADST